MCIGTQLLRHVGTLKGALPGDFDYKVFPAGERHVVAR
jgi:hypothetical protein